MVPRLIQLLVVLASIALGWFVGFGFSFRAAAQESIPPEVLAYADMVLYNGKVLTADDQFTIVEAVAVRGDRFLAAGSSAQMLKLAGPRTRKMDLGGKTVLPGFIDTHQHLHDYAMAGKRWPKIQFRSMDGGLRELKKLVDAAPAGEWVVIEAVSQRRDPPPPELNVRALDAIASDRPVAILYGGLSYVLNNAALRLARIPPDLHGFLKDPQTGEPTGHLIEWASEFFENEGLPWIPIDRMLPLLKQEMLRENATGLTTVCTRLPGNDWTAIKELWRRGELTMRWRTGHEMLRGNPSGEAYLKRMGNLNGFGDDWLSISGLSLRATDPAFATGGEYSWEEKRIAVKPYEHVAPYGLDYWQDRGYSDRRNLILAARYGWSIVGMHSAGSRSNSLLLDAYEQARTQEPIVQTGRQVFALDHGPMLSQKFNHMTKMKEQQVTPSIAMKYIFTGGRGTDQSVALYGADRVSEMSPLKSLIEAGLRPVFEADTGEAPYFHPLWQIEKAVTRTDDSGRAWGRHEAITREQALWMYTNWAASYTGDEKKLGVIQAGRLADLVVLDGDYLKVPADGIGEIPVLMTVVGGTVVFQSRTL